MASAFSHAVAALSLGTCFYRPVMPKRIWVTGALCSILPDIDVIGFRFGIHYGDFWGHRGFTHSLLFAGLVSGMAAAFLFRRAMTAMSDFVLFVYLFLATASHGVLDAMTDGGLGVAFFFPFNNSRYFLPWRPVRVSPVSATRFFTHRGYLVLRSELVWIWVPALIFSTVVLMLKRATPTDVHERTA